MTKLDIQEFEEKREKLVQGLVECAEQLRNTAKGLEDFAQYFNSLDGEVKGKRKELVFGEEESGKKRKRALKPKDPNAPKRPASAYILYQNAVRGPLREQYPDLSHPELLALISEKWKTMPAAEKQEWHERQALLKSKYSEDKKVYDNRSPEEVDAQNKAAAEAAAEAAATKKANRGGRKPKQVPSVEAVQARPPPPESDEDAADSDAEEESEEESVAPSKPSSKKQDSSDDSESSEEEEEEEEEDVEMEEEPAPKRKRSDSGSKSRKK